MRASTASAPRAIALPGLTRHVVVVTLEPAGDAEALGERAAACRSSRRSPGAPTVGPARPTRLVHEHGHGRGAHSSAGGEDLADLPGTVQASGGSCGARGPRRGEGVCRRA